MKKTQMGWVFIILIPLVAAFNLIYFPELLIAISIVTTLFIVLLLFYKLSVEVDNSHVRFSFGIGLIKGKYLLKDINYCKAIKYMPLGWGIRFRPGAILYNVSGNKAIELSVKNKKLKVWIGTNAPDELAAYISSKLPKGRAEN